MPNLRPRRAAQLAAAAVTALSLALTLPGAAQAAPNTDPNTGGETAAVGVDKSSALLTLSKAPLATSPDVERKGKRVNLESPRTEKVQRDLAAQRNALRAWLRKNAPKAKVTGEYDYAVNAVAVRLNGTSVAVLKKAPGVTGVSYQQTYVPTASTVFDDPDLALIKAAQGWQAAGASTSDSTAPSTWAGFGVQVGIIDTGIDTTHPCFSDDGFPKTTQRGDARYTNNKVIVAKVFNNKLNQNQYDAKAVQDHGTHVAGTVACDMLTPAIVSGAEIPYKPSGVAPGAQLGNYNVFPGDVENARSEDILNAMEAAARDGMDVINMSLGGDAHGIQDLLTRAVDNLDRSGIVVAVSAGNEGPGYFTDGSPGSAERALTAGAASVGHYVGVPVKSGTTTLTVGAIGDFPTPTDDLTAAPSVVKGGDGTLGVGCTALPAGSLTGKIALISRGDCTFGQKVYNAEQAGAVAAIIVNNAPGDPIAMAGDAAFSSTIPAVMVPLSARDALIKLDAKEITLGADKAYLYTANDNILADFSSQGPVDVSFRVKPDVVAPGGNVLSSLPASMCEGDAWVKEFGCWGFMSGTSMASPHLAGMAAVVRAEYPSWDAWQVRSAIVNTAKQNGVFQTKAIDKVETDAQRVGSGLAQLDRAVTTRVVFSRVSVSFGSVASGSGKALTQTVKVTNVTDQAVTLPLTVEDASVENVFTVSPSSVSLPAGGSATITVSFQAPRGTTGPVQAHLYVGGANHVVLFGYLK